VNIFIKVKIQSRYEEKSLLPVRLEFTAFRLWDWRAAYCATEAWCSLFKKINIFHRLDTEKKKKLFEKYVLEIEDLSVLRMRLAYNCMKEEDRLSSSLSLPVEKDNNGNS
jgi:hypothetical protein